MLKKLLLQLLVGLFTAITVATLYIKLPHAYTTIDDSMRDYLFRFRGHIPTTGNVIIIDIDEKSLAALGQWPWSRDKIAQILHNLTNAGVGIVGFDIVFAERDNSSPAKVLKELGMPTDNVPDYDKIFAQAVAETPTILGYTFLLERDNMPLAPSPSVPVIFIEKGKGEAEFLLQPYRPILNIQMVQESAYSSGFFNMVPDDDGFVRSVPLAMKYDGSILPSLSLEMIRIASQQKKVSIVYDETGIAGFEMGERSIPTDRYGRIFVNYRGPGKTFPYLSAVDIYNNTFDPAKVAGKFALIGTSASGLLDLRTIPFDSAYPGVESHANIIDNILVGDLISKPSWVSGVDITIIILLALLLSAVFAFTSALWSLIIGIGTAAALLYADYYMLFHKGTILSILFPMTALFMVFILSLVVSYFLETRQKELIKSKFARKVSPAVVEKLMESPDSMILDGQEREISIFFSDIRGFTTLSEAMGSPKRLVSLLNRYMTPMTDIIVRHSGTVDKFIGDAIMAYWNAPGDVAEHPDEAVAAAVEQIEALGALNAELAAEGIPPIDIGIGINTGLATVGEMGSSGRADYTIIGDPVNLASRLEGLNKPYGSHIIISEFTKEKLTRPYIIRDLDLVRVKGKNEPVGIYQVLGRGEPTAEQAQMLTHYHEALALYRNSFFEQAKEHFEALEAQIHDKLFGVYIERCQHFIDNPPENFDGVFTFTTK